MKSGANNSTAHSFYLERKCHMPPTSEHRLQKETKIHLEHTQRQVTIIRPTHNRFQFYSCFYDNYSIPKCKDKITSNNK